MAKYSQNELESLRRAIATGSLRVQYADKNVQYRSLDEMLKLEKLMASDIAGTTTATTSSKTFGIRSSKGL